MKIASVRLAGFRNFDSALINLSDKTLVIGSNDVGKTNLLYAIRMLLDRSLSESDLEPRESDFHIALDGTQKSELRIEIKLSEITEDAVVSRLKGHVSNEGESFLVYTATKSDLSYKTYIGHTLTTCEEIDGRFYLKHIHFKYVESCRDITQYIQREKRYLLKIAKQKRTQEEEAADAASEAMLQGTLNTVNDGINKLKYVSGATTSINDELKNLSHHNAQYAVGLESQVLNFSSFVERLSLGASSGGRRVGLGGDGRNNQILVGLWKAKSEMEHDSENEVVIYCIEEPEAHLHPHQQRKLANYLVSQLHGQVLVSTHSPQIASAFTPDGIVRLLEKNGRTVAASNGCSKGIAQAAGNLGYRMSILPAEAFFADSVFLVEGPSEILFYRALAVQLSIDLDFHNVSILAVDGIAFEIYVKILNALEIPWIVRTDNDVSKVPKSDPPKWRFAGLNRALGLGDELGYLDHDTISSPQELATEWDTESKVLNPKGIYISRIDLETDLASECLAALLAYTEEANAEDAVAFLQKKKALRMGEFLSQQADKLKKIGGGNLALPLHHAVRLSSERRKLAVQLKP
ncbi:MAG TPA: AAA family ATPase [Rariglobus sp.]|jgi:putative ATP-dependent endonuclease of OLD family|nr:AAA family ATPase [Rariglobus sp.]